MNEAMALLALFRGDFYYFVWKCFQTIAPGTRFLPSWHLRAIPCELKRVQRGDTTRLIVNLPPRSGKSISVSVAYVAWLLGHDPRVRFIVASYSSELAAALHLQFRMVIDSDWYKQLFPMMRLAKDTDTRANGLNTTSNRRSKDLGIGSCKAGTLLTCPAKTTISRRALPGVSKVQIFICS